MAKKPKSGKSKGGKKPSTRYRAGAAKGPRSQTLPGMKEARSEALDNLCEEIGDLLDTQTNARTEADTKKVAALKLMRTRGISVYKHAGLELARIPGEEDIRVRRTKSQDDVSVPDGSRAEGSSEERTNGSGDQVESAGT